MNGPIWFTMWGGVEIIPHDPYAAWIKAKRDEAQRLHRHNHREWIKAGAFPAPKYGATTC